MANKTVSSKVAKKRRPGTSVDGVYKALYDRIIAGVYPPLFKMSQLELAEEFKISRTPLREALNRLHAGGLLIADANRGMEVAPVHNASAEEGYAARLLLEPPLVAALCAGFSKGDLEEMEVALEDMKRFGHRNREFQQAHLRFHMVALRHYPEVIRDIVLTLYDQSHRHQCIHFSRPRIPNDFVDVDRSYLDAIRAKDTDRVRQLLEFHLIDACIGMALDIDPDHIPNSLMLAAKGVGIEFEDSGGKVLQRPIRIAWLRDDAGKAPRLQTTNLVSAPAPALPKRERGPARKG